MVWDGDQMLYEIAAPGGSTASAADMEKDTGLATPFGTGGNGYFFPTGRVEYVHGHGIDQPLRFYREEYSDSIPGASFIPQANWRGVYDMGVRSGLCYTRNWTTQPAEPTGERQVGSDTTSYPVGTSGTETLCADVNWPAQYTWAYGQYRRGYHGPYNWMGSLAFGMRDASGLHYRRNRFYDAEQGRFTQEDPIGLAGGINLYGYANGDPVSYSDPYGLCRRPKGKGVGICLESFIAAKWVLGAPVGDHRGPRSDGGSFRTHVSFSVDPATGTISGLNSANGRTLAVPGRGQAWVGPAQSDGNGGWNIAVVGYGKTNAAPLPYINYAFGINVAADGTVTMDGGGHDGYPSYEVWSYSEDGRATNVYHHQEGWVTELAGVADVKVPEKEKQQ
jgi:RHS repeat-associated protein